MKLSFWFITGDKSDLRGMWWIIGDDLPEGSDMTYSITYTTQQETINVENSNYCGAIQQLLWKFISNQTDT